MRSTSEILPETGPSLSIYRPLRILVILFVLTVAAIVGLAVFGLGILSSTRAYVGGEGLWSKAQKDAIYALSRYLMTSDETYYKVFQARLAVPLGDRQARLELEKPDFDGAAVREGFLQGRNHASDIEGMARLFRRFRRYEPLDRAISLWERGDALIGELSALAETVHGQGLTGRLDARARDAYLKEIDRLNDHLTTLEDGFSTSLGQAARSLRRLVIGAILLMTGLLGAIGLVASFRIGTVLQAHQEALAASERRYRLLFQRNLAGIYRTTMDGLMLQCNSSFARILGYSSPEEVMRLSAWDLYFDPVDRTSWLERLQEQRTLVNYEICLKRKDGSPVWVLANESLLEGEAAGSAVMEGSLIDITDRRLAEEKNRYQASHDALTKLPNRLLFSDRLSLAILQAHRRKQILALMFLDLDQFKHVNDTLGHSTGDEVLVQVAERLKHSLREDDTVGRLGGDEFVVLVAGIASENDVAHLARKVLAALSEPLHVGKREVFLSASIGIALYPNDGTTSEALLSNVDTAMYRAKELGRNNFQFFTRRMQELSLERASLESGLRRALPRGEFVVYYQPVLERKGRHVTGVEALLRWNHPEKGLLPPRDFIPLAEELGLIVSVGDWVLRQACEQALRWHAAGASGLRVAVNLSARQFQKRDLPRTVRRILEDTGLPAHHLDLEITESIAMQNPSQTGEELRELYGMGVQISIDDFGTGHSSLSYLKHFPIHRLKVDQSFVAGIAADAKDRAIVAAIVALAHNLGLSVAAEGVETSAQAEILSELGCDELQGYLFGYPVPAADLDARLRSPA